MITRHLDDFDWTEVQRQRNADGSVSVVREKWPIIRSGFLSAHVHYEPNMVVRRHGHRSNHVVIVLDGGAHIGVAPDSDVWCERGMHLHVPLGATFGPIIAGPEGVTCWEVSFGEFGGWGDEPEIVERELRERGITPLPDPPLEIGDWFVDPRGDWGGERPNPRVPGLAEVLVDLDDPANGLERVTPAPGVHLTRAIAEPGFTSTMLVLEPGATFVTDEHGTPDARRRGTRLLWIDGGSVVLDGEAHPAGTHVEIPAGDALATITGGPDGARVFELVNIDGDGED